MGKLSEYEQLPDTDNGSEAVREKAAADIGIANHIVKAIDLLDLSGIFVMNGFDVAKLLFEHLARYIMLPVAALSTILFTIFSWRQFCLSKDKDVKGFLLSKAIFETLGAGAVNAAVIGGLVSAAFTIGPYLFVAALVSKALMYLGTGIYFTYKAYQNRHNKEKYEKFKSYAIDSWAGFAVGIFAAATVVTVIIFLQTAFWAMGAVTMALGAAFAIYKAGKHYYDKRKLAKAAMVVNDDGNEKNHDEQHDAKKTLGMNSKRVVAVLQTPEGQSGDNCSLSDCEYTEAHAHASNSVSGFDSKKDSKNDPVRVETAQSSDKQDVAKLSSSEGEAQNDDELTYDEYKRVMHL